MSNDQETQQKKEDIQNILLDFFGSKDVLGMYSLNYSEDELRHYFLTHSKLDVIPDDISSLKEEEVSRYLEAACQFLDDKGAQEKSYQFRQLCAKII
jgi:hypothetical protein